MTEMLIGAIGMYIILSIIAVILDIAKGDDYAGIPILILGEGVSFICRVIINLTYGMYWKHKILALPNWRYWGWETLHANSDKEAKKILLKSKSFSCLTDDYNRLKRLLENGNEG